MALGQVIKANQMVITNDLMPFTALISLGLEMTISLGIIFVHQR